MHIASKPVPTGQPSAKQTEDGADRREAACQLGNHGSPTACTPSPDCTNHVNLCNNLALICNILFNVVFLEGKAAAVHQVLVTSLNGGEVPIIDSLVPFQN